MIKSIGLLLLGSLYRITALACDGCQKQQSAIVQQVSAHGRKPDSQWDYLIVSIVTLFVVVTLFYSIKWLVKPGERSASHIKNLIMK
jgi:hypothetical protein